MYRPSSVYAAFRVIPAKDEQLLIEPCCGHAACALAECRHAVRQEKREK
ncbi:MAG: hypothetical protein J6A23_06895 [Thermoguttaceae bacterium]|nr:hypothetical protein [Thermoguttaceae bacterium]